MSSYHPLHDGWTLTAVDGSPVPEGLAAVSVPAAVPGCVHTDLLAAGVIPDPYLDDNEAALAWIGRCDWVYETTVEWSGTDQPRVDLVCAGLDTVATVSVNGVEVGRTANMHRSYRFDVAPLLRLGPNTVQVRLDSAYRYAEALRDALGDRPNAYPEPFNFIRKMACHFGWDWGPTLVTAGIWQGIGLQAWGSARLASVRPLVTVADDVGRVEVHTEVERATDAPLIVRVAVGAVTNEVVIPAGARGTAVAVAVTEPALWWPRGYGDQARYPLEVTLCDQDGAALDSWRRLVGFRSVRIDTSADAVGSAFTVVVNDVPVFAKGVNWIPDDVFLTRVTRARYSDRLTQAVKAGVNFVRVWGGGRYESDDFYDLADELGIMVGQDFLFACAAYPEEEPISSEVAAEAAEHVVRLASHPSLVMWVGNNENIWGWHDWGWRDRLDGRSWGAGYYHSVLPAIVSALDPTRPYWPGSPWSGSAELHPNEPGHGTMHIWDVWNTDDYTAYRRYVPRFVAEFGYQAPPTYATLRRALSDDPLTANSPGMAQHQKAADGDAKLRRGLDAHLPEPQNFDDWHYLTQVNQARAVQLGIEHFRSHQPVCMGTVVWQLNDCWPVTSWAAVDGDGRRKPLWYALRRAYADRLLTIQPRDGGLALIAVNDSGKPWVSTVAVRRLSTSGEQCAVTSVDVDVPARSASVVPLPSEVATALVPRRELLLAEAGERRSWWFFAEDKSAELPCARFEASAVPAPGGARVTVTALSLLRDLALFPDRVDPTASTDDALITLLPGESVTFEVQGANLCDLDALTRRPVLRCVNDVGADPGSGV